MALDMKHNYYTMSSTLIARQLTFSFELHQTGGTIALADLLPPDNRR